MTHFLMMVLFGFLVSVVFAIVAHERGHLRMLYGLKIFAQFVGAGLALGWLLYFLPR